jgi:hypothetical protein
MRERQNASKFFRGPENEDRMPYYEYRCAANGRTVEVRHPMGERLVTWGEVAGRAGVDLGGTPADAAVERLLSAPVPVTGGSPGAARDVGAGCGPGCACARQA